MSNVPPERIFINYPPEDFNDPWFFQSDFGNTEYISLSAHEKAVADLKAEVEQWKANAHHHGADAYRLASELVDAQRLIAKLTAKGGSDAK